MATKKRFIWKLEVELSIDPMWVADGFEATPGRIKELLEEKLLDYAYGHEKIIKVKTLEAPEQSRIRLEQGYKDEVK